MIYIGTAGWSVHARYADCFPAEGTHLARYGQVLNAAEINSSFYRPHQRATYERWAAAVPAEFRFAVKVPKAATHTARLVGTEAILNRFLNEVTGLGEKLGPLLVQLPPKLAFGAENAGAFFATLRERHQGPVACEPRHPSWFTPEAGALLTEHRIARVAADPPAGSPAAAEPGGWKRLVYYRLHGTPRVYYSDYSEEALSVVAAKLADASAAGAEAWCILDNTAAFAALGNALQLQLNLTASNRLLSRR